MKRRRSSVSNVDGSSTGWTRSRDDSAPWSVVRLDVPAERADELAGQLGGGSLGVEVVPGAGASELRVYLRREAPPALDAIEARLRANGLDPVRCRPRLEAVDDGRWVERYQAGLAPFPLGTRFVVRPGDAPAPAGARRVVRLVPGRAFGTGTHPTTRLCAEALERDVRRGSRWLDLGCGSGILSVVALGCGADEVVALDVDPEAVAVADEVLRANGLRDRARTITGSVDRLRDETFDGVVANIAASFFLTRGAALAARVAPGGVLLASGFLEPDAARVAAALSGAGLAGAGAARLEGWSVLRHRRAGER